MTIAERDVAVERDVAESTVAPRRVMMRFCDGVFTPLEPVDLPDYALVAVDIVIVADPDSDAPGSATLPWIFDGDDVFVDARRPGVNFNKLNTALMDREFFEKHRKWRDECA